MAEGTDQLVRAFVQLTGALLEQAARLAIRMIERRAELLRQAAAQGERKARAERARLAGHHAADATIWRRTSKPDWWRTADERRIAEAWRAASTWHQVDPEAAGAREAIAERLARRGVDVTQDVTANPADAKWLSTALALAQAEREELVALAAELDTDYAEVAAEILWQADETVAPTANGRTPAAPEPLSEPTSNRRRRSAAADIAAEIVWNDDELPADRHEQRKHRATADLAAPAPAEAASDTRLGSVVVDPQNSSAAVAAAASTLEPSSTAARAPRQKPRPTLAIEPGESRRHTQVDVSAMEQMLRSAWPQDKADRVIDDGAWPALASTMQNLTAAGKDVPGLLRDIPFDTTDGKVPAVLTQWALRHAAAGPVALQWAQQRRQTQQQKVDALHRQTPARVQLDEPGVDSDHANNSVNDSVSNSLGSDVTAGTAQRWQAAYPLTTAQALHRRVAAAEQIRPAPAAARQHTAQRERPEAETTTR